MHPRDEAEDDEAILREEAHVALAAANRRHMRTLVWIIVLVLIVASLHALALMKIAARPMILVLPTHEIEARPAAPAAREPRAATGNRLNAVSSAAYGLQPPAYRSHPFRRLVTADMAMAPGKTPAGGSARRVRASVPPSPLRVLASSRFDRGAILCVLRADRRLLATSCARAEISPISGLLMKLKGPLAASSGKN